MIHEICPSVYSVGVVDSNVRIFHGYQVPFGTTYNSYLLIDGENAILVDFVKVAFAQELLDNIKQILGDKPLTHIICNHVEPDHSGALPAVTAAYPHAEVYGTKACERELKAYYPHATYSFHTVTAGDSLNTGTFTFSFIPMPMVHWPDSMSTYVSEIKTLFSNDALGQHIGTGDFKDSDIDAEFLMERAGDYYANIVLPYGMQVDKLLDATAGLNIERICPSHGVILESRITEMIAAYKKWAAGTTDDQRGIIIYDTMWGTTAKLAQQIAEKWESEGISAEIINLSDKHYSYALTRLLEARFVAVGSPTLNNQMLPSVAAFLTYAKGLRPHNHSGLAFGSYGWSGESVKYIQAELESMGFDILESYKVQWNIEE